MAGLLVLVVAATAAANAAIATDVSRASSTVIHAAVLGILLLVRSRPRQACWVLAAALAFNLLLPARHVIEGWSVGIPILPLHVELKRFEHPPPHVALFYLARAAKLGEKRRPMRALVEIDAAAKIDPRSAVVQIMKGCIAG